jgi:phosphodiesterase/alkaline phosphatase D-like protein
MMMGGDKKRLAAIIIGRMAPKAPVSGDANAKAFSERAKEPEAEEMSDLEAVADDILSAIAAKDAKGLAQSLHAFYQMADDDEEDEEKGEESESGLGEKLLG